jgi:hypothetical protein
MRFSAATALRIFITPEWVGIFDFETHFPNAIEHAMERAAGRVPNSNPRLRI